MKNFKRRRLTVLLPVLFLLAVAISRSEPALAQTIVLGAVTTMESSLVWVAESKEYFQEQDLKVEIKEFESGRTALRAMLNEGGIDIVTAAQTPVVFNSFDRNDYAIVGNMFCSDNDAKILVRRDRGISAPSNLRNKTVGITAHSAAHFFLSLFLAHHGLHIDDVHTMDIEATRLPEALIDGKVDAIATWEPNIYRAQKALGERALLLPSINLYRLELYFIARKDFIKSNSDVLKRFLRAIEKAESFISKNPKEARDIVEKRLKMNRELIDAIWNEFRFALFLDQSILTSLEDEARWAIGSRLTSATKVPNYLNFIYVDALKAVKPDVVTILGK